MVVTPQWSFSSSCKLQDPRSVSNLDLIRAGHKQTNKQT